MLIKRLVTWILVITASSYNRKDNKKVYTHFIQHVKAVSSSDTMDI